MYYQEGSSEMIQADASGLQTLYLMNPNYAGYSNTQTLNPANMVLLNTAATTQGHALNSTPVQFAPLHQQQAQQFMSIPLSHDHPNHEIQATHEQTTPRYHYNSWPGSVDHQPAAVSNGNHQPNLPQQTPQGLSLSLSTHQTCVGKNSLDSSDQDFREKSSVGVNLAKIFPSQSVHATVVSNGVSNSQNIIAGSKYLKAVQQLLDEVANVRNDVVSDKPAGSKDKAKTTKESSNICTNTVDSINGGESGAADQLTTPQRQEIQMKKAKLISMLDEVEHRYRQYHLQMQIVVESFEQAAGIGSARSYTQLALKTISRQFRCLKDAISSQIRVLSKSLGEEAKFEGSKLKSIDHQLRQHRALQQLGMVQNNAWRPQRGLPERAVLVLRTWLFEHFLHPYPKDSDKQILAKQTGLTRSQVSNWFINARVRLWKPMVEEMYLEEMKNQEQNSSGENITKTGNGQKESGSNVSIRQENMSAKPNQVLSPAEISPGKKAKTLETHDNSPSSIISVENENYSSVAADNIIAGHGTGFGTYGIGGQLEKFHTAEEFATSFYQNNKNNVSLTLGLPPSGTSQVSTGTHQLNFLSDPSNFGFGPRMGNGIVENRSFNGMNQDPSHSNIGYEQILDFQKRKPAFPAQLLPDFVA